MGFTECLQNVNFTVTTKVLNLVYKSATIGSVLWCPVARGIPERYGMK